MSGLVVEALLATMIGRRRKTSRGVDGTLTPWLTRCTNTSIRLLN